MLVIVGESASGKSALQKMLVASDPKYKKVVTYTTRPKRKNEKDGVDYHFVTVDKFKKLIDKDFFIESAKYSDWLYGTAKKDCIGDENNVAVLTPAGLRALKRAGVDVTSVYLYVDRRSRLINILNRGDNIDEAYRRNLSDVGQFDGIADEVDYVIDNTSFHMNQKQVLKCLNAVLGNSGGNDENI